MNSVFLLALALALPDALLNRPYVPEARWERVSTRCAMPIPTTRVVGGSLPPGLQMTGRGAVEGVPTLPGNYNFLVEISDGCDRRIEPRQIRVIPAPILIAEAETAAYQCIHGAPPFPGGQVRVSGSPPGRAYSVDILDAPWLRATMRDGVLPAEGLAFESDTLSLTIDPGKLSAGVYTARLRVSTWQGANTPELLFTLRVDAPDKILAPLTVLPAPVPHRPVVTFVEAPIEPPAAHRPAPPTFPKYKPRSKSRPAGVQAASAGRSRVLPFPKVTIPLKPAANKPDPKTAPQKEAPPERTKPSAMPAAQAKH